jgi:hypothetical protein
MRRRLLGFMAAMELEGVSEGSGSSGIFFGGNGRLH